MQFDVFLSHAKEDYNLVWRVWDLLDRMNITAYMYELYPQYGEVLTEAIKKAINDSKIFVAFLTRSGVSSQWVNQEIGVAHAIGRKIIPVRETEVESKGFVELRIVLPFSPNDPELMIYNLTTRLRDLLIFM